MNPMRIDTIARVLAEPGNRRSFLSIIFTVIFALRGSAFPVKAQEGCPQGCADPLTCIAGFCQQTCVNHRDCRSKRDDPCINNSCLDGVCVQAIVECMPGYECCQGECCHKSCETNEECAVFDPCRIGSCLEGTCVFDEIDPCIVCAADADCLASGMNTLCCGGACRRPCPEGTVMGKGCQCTASATGTGNGLIVRDDASG